MLHTGLVMLHGINNLVHKHYLKSKNPPTFATSKDKKLWVTETVIHSLSV